MLFLDALLYCLMLMTAGRLELMMLTGKRAVFRLWCFCCRFDPENPASAARHRLDCACWFGRTLAKMWRVLDSPKVLH